MSMGNSRSRGDRIMLTPPSRKASTSPRYSLDIPRQPRARRNSCTAVLNECYHPLLLRCGRMPCSAIRDPPLLDCLPQVLDRHLHHVRTHRFSPISSSKKAPHSTSATSADSGSATYGYRFSCSSERTAAAAAAAEPLVQKLSDSVISLRRPQFDHSSHESPHSPHPLSHSHYQNHSSSGSSARQTRHHMHRSSLSGSGVPAATASGQLSEQLPGSASSSPSYRASLAADMFTETGDFGITLAEQLQLSRAVIANDALSKELFQKASIIEGFTSYKCYDVREHAKSLMELIDFTLQGIHSSTKVVQERCMALGAAHCSASERSMSSSWDHFGDSFAEAITKADSIRGRRECLKAWNALLSFVVDSMKGGYLAESKRRSSKKSSRQEPVGAASYIAAEAAAASATTSSTYH